MGFTNNEHYFLAGGGEMGEQIRTKDWSKTSLGDPKTWPQSLQTMVAVMLHNPFGMYIAWGENYMQLYNDSFRPILQASKHTEALGISSEITFSEIWEIIGPMFSDVMKGEAVSFPDFMVPLQRNGVTEECYFDFSYTPIKKEDGTVGGILVTAIETTEKKKAAEALKENNDRFVNNIMQVPVAPVGITILRGTDYIVEMANEAYLKLVGREENEFVGKPLFDSLPKVRETVDSLLNGVLTTGIPYYGNEVPVPINRYGKEEKIYYFDFLYHPLKEEDGEISGIIVNVTEVTEKVEARKKTELNEERLNIIVEASELGTWELNVKEKEIQYSKRYLEIVTGKKDMQNLSHQELIKYIHPDDIPVREKALTDAIASGYLHYEARLIWDDQSIRWVEAKGKVFYDTENQPEKLLGTVRDITEEKKYQQEIEKSEKAFRNLVMQSPVPKAILRGKDMTIEMVNLALLKNIWRKNESEVQGKRIQDVFPELEEQKYMALLNEVYQTGNVHSETESLLFINDANGGYKLYIDFEYAPLREADNTISGIKITTIDVTEKVEARKKIEESEKRFRSLTESLPQLIWETDEKGNALFASCKWLEITGVHPKGQDEWKTLIHPNDFEENSKIWNHSLQTGEGYRFDVRIKNKNGGYRWHTAIGEPVFDKDNKIVKWVGAFTDIHTEKAFTHELEQQVSARTKELIQINETLRKSEERYHLMIEEVQDYSILYLNHNGIIENWNVGAEKIKGYRAEEIIGKYFAVFYTEKDQKNNLPQKLLQIACEKGKAVHEGWRVRKDGTHFWASVVITAVHNKQNEVIGFSKVTHDLTEKKRADDKLKLNALELEQKNTELEQINKELQSFTYISSHDLQEPLRKIQTFASQIMDRELDNLSESGKDKFQRMQNAAQRMQTLINDLLSYSRTNIQERVFEKTDLAAIINEVKEDLKEELEQKGALVEIGETSEVNIIPFQFRQLLYNLVSNSIKFTKPDILPVIKITSETGHGKDFDYDKLKNKKKYCHISISDNGIGFDQSYSKKIFEVFQRLHGREIYNGTGIGLAIVKKIVENHNGFITAKGELDRGATFDIYIPAI